MAEVKLVIKQIDQGSKGIGDTAKRLEGLLDVAQKSAVAVAAAGVTFKQAFDLSREGANLNQLTKSFELMNEQVFQTPDLLNQMSEAARGTIKETDLMAGLLKLTAGASDELAGRLAQASPQLIEIAKASNKLNPSLGDTAFLYDSIATGIKRASPLILDNLGIVVKVGEANERYASQIGKAVEALTAEEKQIALLNEVLRSGDQLIQQVGGNVDSQADSWARLEVQIGTLTDEFKQFLADGLGPVVSTLAGDYGNAVDSTIEKTVNSTKSIEELIDAGQRMQAVYEDVGKAGLIVTGTTDEFNAGIQENILQIAAASGSLEELEANLVAAFGEDASTLLRDNMIGIRGVTVGLDEMQAVLGTNTAAIKEQAVAAAAADIKFANYRQSLGLTTEEIIAFSAAQAEARGGNEELNDKIAQTANQWDLYEASANNAAIAQAKAAEANEAHVVAMEEAARAAEMAKQQMTNYFTAALNTSDGIGLYNESAAEMVDRTIAVSNLSSDQRMALEDLQAAYGKAQETITDYTMGAKGVGLTTEQVNEKIGEQQARMAELEAAMAPLLSIGNEYVNVAGSMTINQDALNMAVFESAQQAGASAEQLAILGGALGLYSDEAVEAALKTAIIQAEIDRLAQSYAEGDLTVGQMTAQLNNFIAGLDETSGSLSHSGQEIDALVDKMNNMPDGHVFRVKIEQDGALPSLPSGPVGKNAVGAFALGGFLRPGEVSQVGEFNLPELFTQGGKLFMIPGDQGQVFSNSQSKGMMGGNTTLNAPITINVQGSGDPQAISAAVQDALLRSMRTVGVQ